MILRTAAVAVLKGGAEHAIRVRGGDTAIQSRHGGDGLLDLDLGADLLERGLDLLGLVAGDTFLDRLR